MLLSIDIHAFNHFKKLNTRYIQYLPFPRFSRHARMLTMNRRELQETNERHSRVQNRSCQTSYRKRSFSLDVTKRLGIGEDLLYNWVRKSKPPEEPVIEDLMLIREENAKLRAKLRRTTEERDILKKATVYFAKQSE